MTLGITANELFACNPFRILGIAVNTPDEQVVETYNRLMEKANKNQIVNYTSEFDFNGALPPFERTAASIKTAYSKLASNGYRCFAYEDSQFSASLNIDDVMLNLRDITCYDCFLRCYMWLIINDRQFEEPELWINLCKYIDKLIDSQSSEWSKYFDNRFPKNEENAANLSSFYNTFCELILLPIKELARGSMKCKKAMDVLKVAGVDLGEVFEFIEIPQANKAPAGQPQPMLKIAVKSEEELINNKHSAAVENNIFATADTSISADILEAVEDKPVEAQSPEKESKPNPFANLGKSTDSANSNSSAVSGGENDLKPKKHVDEIVTPMRRNRVVPTPNGGAAAINNTAPVFSKPKPAEENAVVFNAPKTSSAAVSNPATQNSVPFKKTAKTLNSLVEETDNLTKSIAFEEEDDDDYKNLLIKMLRDNRTTGRKMQEVDTKHAFDNGDALGSPEAKKFSMDAINMNKYDKTRLGELSPEDENDPQKLREEKFKNINISDMLNPNMGRKSQNSFESDAIIEYKLEKKKDKSLRKTVLGLAVFIGAMVIIFLFLFFMGII